MNRPIRIAIPIDLDWPLKRHHEVLAGIQDYAKSHAPHWELVPDLFPTPWIAPSDNNPGYDAIFGRVSKSEAEAAKQAGIPVVNVWLNSPVVNEVPSVLVDYCEIGRMAAEHLVSRGLRQLGAMGYRRDTATRMFFQGMKSVAQQQGIPLSCQLANFTNRRDEKTWHSHVNDLNRWIDNWHMPIGVAAAYDNAARVLASMCRRRDILIPEQVAIIGTGDEPVLCESTEPELSSIDMGHYRAGYQGAELLDQLLHGADPPTEPIMTPPAELVARQSTDVYAVADKTVGRAMRFIAEHCGEKIRVADVANHVGIDRQKLEKQFRDAGIRTINAEIVALRIELTKRLLIGSNDSINDVALAAGFGTAQHMRHVFRHQLRTTPKAFREEHRKKQ